MDEEKINSENPEITEEKPAEQEEKTESVPGKKESKKENKKASKEDQKATADFIYWLYSSKTGKDYVTNKLGFIAPFDTFEDNEKPTDPLAKEIIKWMSKPGITSVAWNFTLFPSRHSRITLVLLCSAMHRVLKTGQM